MEQLMDCFVEFATGLMYLWYHTYIIAHFLLFSYAILVCIVQIYTLYKKKNVFAKH